MAYTDYSTITADSPEELATRLNEGIADGWQPYGAPVCITLQQVSKSFRLMQAVVKGSPDGGGGGGGPDEITADDITDATATGKAVLTGADAAAARTAIGAGTSSFTGSYNDLTEKPTIPTAPAAGDAVKLQAGTDTVASLWSAKVISDEIKRQIAAIPPA
jgi:hypothetical protein